MVNFSESNDPAAIAQFAWIPQAILHMASTTTEVKLVRVRTEVLTRNLPVSFVRNRAIAEQVIAEYILPLPSSPSSSSKGNEVDEGAWTDRLLYTMKFLDGTAINAILSLSGMKGL